MFEFIGLFIDIAIFLIFSAAAGVVFALLAWTLLRKRTLFRIIPALGAAAVPVASAVWIIVGVIFFAWVFPGESYTLFGDIEEPLPNGFYLTGLGKMPDFAVIHHGADFSGPSPNLSKCVGGIAVDGNLVVGAYSHPCSEFSAVGNQGFFLFNTDDGTVHDYDTLPEIEKVIGHNVHTVPVEEFRSHESFYLNDLVRENAVLFGPPVIAMLGYLAFLIRLSSRRHAHSGQ